MTIDKGFGARNVDSGLQVQLEKDEDDGASRAGWRQVVCGQCSTGNDRT